MPTSETTLEVLERTDLGKNASRRLRRTGYVPAVVYGGDLDPLPIHLETRTLQKLLKASGENAVFLLKLQGTDESRHSMIKEIHFDALTGNPLHIDFLRVDMSQKVRVHVPIELVGVPVGVKRDGGILDFVSRDVHVQCLPADIPERLLLDVAELHIGQHAEARHVQLPPNVELQDDPAKVLVSISIARVAAEATPAEEGLIEAAQAEPEVIHRGKEEAKE